MTNLRQDDRALAIGTVMFFAMLLIAALLYLLIAGPFNDVATITTDQASQSGATDQINSAQGIWDNMLYYVLFVSALFIIARAAREASRS